MKKTISILLSLFMIMSLAGCGNTSGQGSQASAVNNFAQSDMPQGAAETNESEQESTAAQPDETESEETASSEPEEAKGSSILIAYFTYGENAEVPNDVDTSSSASIQIFNGEVTGNTGVMARMIADASGGELFSIRTAKPYPDSYDATVDAGQSEKNNGVRPEIALHIENPDQYDTIFVGFPNWWYGMPMVMYSFFDEYDFSGKTVIPFCTSGGSAFSDAIEEIRAMEPDATVLDGLHISGSSVSDAESRVSEWVAELGLSK